MQLLYAQAQRKELANQDFLAFVKMMWPQFVEGYHHKVIAKLFNKLATKGNQRIIINMAPRHTKSEFASVYLPAWYMGRYPDRKIIQATHTADLAVNFGRQVKNLVDRPDYQNLFPHTALAADSKASGKWATTQNGQYFAVGVGANIAGKGADLFIIDDPHSEQTLMLANGFENDMRWYEAGPRQRLQPGANIVIVMTRWSEKDLTGQLIKKMANNPKSDQWEVVELPAILPSGEPCWPEFWSKDALEATRSSISPYLWQAQYLQQPTSESNAILKREWWREWEYDDIPDLHYIIQSYDTAYSAKENADYSAISTWGVFTAEKGKKGIILLDARKDRWDFPELKRKAIEAVQYWEPDTCLIEAKATGTPLTQELRQIGIPVVNFTPAKGLDKVARAHSVSPILESGLVYYPAGQQWALEFIEECAAFPNGENDDFVDTMTQALMRYRNGNFIRLPSDDTSWLDSDIRDRVRPPQYYG